MPEQRHHAGRARAPGAAPAAGEPALTMRVAAQLDFDGNIEYTVALTAARATPVRDIRLEIPVAADVARYLMGMGRKGGVRPDTMTWRWDRTRNQDAAWIGDVNAGLQFTLKDERYEHWVRLNLPHARIIERNIANYPPETLFVVYCAGPHCNGADRAAVRLARLGRPVKKMIGGIEGWKDEGFALSAD